jgi:hypothetical protein
MFRRRRPPPIIIIAIDRRDTEAPAQRGAWTGWLPAVWHRTVELVSIVLAAAVVYLTVAYNREADRQARALELARRANLIQQVSAYEQEVGYPRSLWVVSIAIQNTGQAVARDVRLLLHESEPCDFDLTDKLLCRRLVITDGIPSAVTAGVAVIPENLHNDWGHYYEMHVANLYPYDSLTISARFNVSSRLEHKLIGSERALFQSTGSELSLPLDPSGRAETAQTRCAVERSLRPLVIYSTLTTTTPLVTPPYRLGGSPDPECGWTLYCPPAC